MLHLHYSIILIITLANFLYNISMAFNVEKHIQWQAGEGTPIKYGLDISLICNLVNIKENVATFSLQGTVTLFNHPNNSQNSWPASDFAVLTLGGYDPYDCPFTQGTSYYQQPLPFLPNAPQSYLDAMILEFRGDTARPNPNRISLWLKGAGVVADTINTEYSQTFDVNTTFQLTLTGNPQQEVLIWSGSGAADSTHYGWGERQVWATMLDFDYRPGAIYNDSNWMSHNRSNGDRRIYDGSNWKELRTIDGGVGTNNPPSIYNGNRWVNQRRVGQDG